MNRELPQPHFGSADDGVVDWRDVPVDEEDDDELRQPTPPDVVEMLGFDPLDGDDDGELSKYNEHHDDHGRFASSDGFDWSPGGGSKTTRVGSTTIDYGVSSDGRTAELILIKTPRSKRGQGSAREALNRFLKAADARRLSVSLTPEPMDKGVSKTRLIGFYKSLGFREVGSKMVREPLLKFNQNHVPGGSPQGGQFTSGGVGSNFRQKLAAAWIAGKTSSFGRNWTYLQSAARRVLSGQRPQTEAERMASQAIRQINSSAPLQYPLYRGITATTANYKVGDTFSESLSSWTPKLAWAGKYASGDIGTHSFGPGTGGDEDNKVVLVLKGTGMKALAVGRWLSPQDKARLPKDFLATDEHLASGEYRVTKVTPTEHFHVVEVERIGNALPADLARAETTDDLLKFNPNHAPRGSPEGGQFISAQGAFSFLTDADKANQRQIQQHLQSERLSAKAKAQLDLHPDIRETIEEHLGTSPEKVTEELSHGVDARLQLDNVLQNGHAVTMNWNLYDQGSGAKMGNVERTFYGGYVSHDNFFLGEAYQGKGLAKQVLNSFDHLYENAGIDQVSVHAAADKGGYVWAKFGFVPKQHDWDSLREQLFYENERQLTPRLRRILDNEDPKSIWKLADSPVGKSWLMGTDWHGELDRTDEQSMKRFRRYVHKGGAVRKMDAPGGRMLNEADLAYLLIEEAEGSDGFLKFEKADAEYYYDPKVGKSFKKLPVGIDWQTYGGKRDQLAAKIKQWLDHAKASTVAELRKRSLTKAFNPDEPRDDHGRWSAEDGVPDAPGTTPIPEGHVRLYHQTSVEAAEKIRSEGIRLDKARGIEGPRAIYADEKGFYGKPGDTPTVEFHVPKGEWDKPFVRADRVDPKNIIAIHYPWHSHARYIEHEEPKLIREVVSGEHDSLLSDKDYGPAIRYIKNKYRTNKLAKFSQHHDAKGRFAAADGTGDAHKSVDPAGARDRGTLAKATPDEEDQRIAQEIADAIAMGDAAVLVQYAEDGLTDAIREGARRGLAQLDFSPENYSQIFDRIDPNMVDWAENRAAEMVGMRWTNDGRLVESLNAEKRIDTTTRGMVRGLIASGLGEGKRLTEIADDLEGLGPYPFSDERAHLIASTEIANAASQGALTAAKSARDDAEVDLLKAWLVADTPCPVCEENAEAGPIPLEEPFPSGDDAPTAHPNCRCALIFRVLGDEPDAEDEADTTDAGFEGEPINLVAKYFDVLGQELFSELTGNLVKFNPNHAPAGSGKGGQFTSGYGAAAGSGDTALLAEAEKAKEQAILHIAREYAEQEGYDPNKVVVKKNAPEFEVNGQKLKAGALAYTKGENKGQIEVYADSIPHPQFLQSAEFRSLMAHEIEHQRFQTVLDRYQAENLKMQGEYQALKEAGHGNLYIDRNGPLKPDGTVRDTYVDKFPVYSRLAPIIDRSSDLARQDGVSDYSRLYWAGFEHGTNSALMATHETLAEMAANRVRMGDVPRLLSPVHEEAMAGVRSATGGSSLWQTLYHTVNDLYEGRDKWQA